MPELADLIRRAWPLFREAARQGRTITYTELAGRVGPPLTRRQIHRQLLVPLSVVCRRAEVPDLSAFVVRKDTGRPGGGWNPTGGGLDWPDALAACFAYPWPPTPASLLRVIEPEACRESGEPTACP